MNGKQKVDLNGPSGLAISEVAQHPRGRPPAWAAASAVRTGSVFSIALSVRPMRCGKITNLVDPFTCIRQIFTGARHENVLLDTYHDDILPDFSVREKIILLILCYSIIF